MIPITLKLKCFLSYREAAILDFTQFDMACVTGQNGAGKSSLLDAMTWALFGKARSNDDDLIHMQENEMEVSLVFDYEAQRYEVRRSKRRNSTKTLVFEIWSEESQTWRNFTEATMGATQSKLDRILRMDYETFINASFFLQGKADQFAQQRPAERKNTLAKILELEVWDEYQKKAAGLRKKFDNRLMTIENVLEGIHAELAKEAELKERSISLHEKLAQLEATAKTQEEIVLHFRKQQEQAGKQKEHVALVERNLESARKRADELRRSLDNYQHEQVALMKLLENEPAIHEALIQWHEDQKMLEQLDLLSRQVEEIRKEREVPHGVVTTEEARLRAAIEQLRIRDSQMEESRKNLEKQQKQLMETEEEEAAVEAESSRYILMEEQHDDLAELVKQTEIERARVLREMQLLVERIGKLENLSTSVCPTCGQPLTNEHREALIQELRVQGHDLKEKYDQGFANLQQMKEELNSLDLEIKRLHRLEKERLLKVIRPRLDSLRMNILMITSELDEWEDNGKVSLNGYESMLATDQFADEARQTLAEIDSRLTGLGYDVKQHDLLRQREREGRQSQEDWQAVGKARATLETLDRMVVEQKGQLENLVSERNAAQEAYEGAIDQYQAMLEGVEGFDDANRRWLEMRNAVSQTSRELGGAEQAVNSLKNYKEQQAMYQLEKQDLMVKIDRYKQLEDAFSKNGVQALLIEQAIPEIEEQANEILSQLSSSGMRVEFRTQVGFRDQKRNDKKETLEIVIGDNAGVRSYEMYSGGEAFRVNFAIRLALSRMLASRAGARLQTLVIDEGFGSQDAEGVQRLVEAINIIQDEFAKIIVITHMETLKESFPAQIEVIKTPTGSKFQVLV